MNNDNTSTTDIKSYLKSINSSNKKELQDQMIGRQEGEHPGYPPVIYISGFDFNLSNRVAHIEYTQDYSKRRIIKYVTKNYVKYPIYGPFVKRSKKINKTIRLYNDVLESLNVNPDPLISQFSYEIIERLNESSLIPSWCYFELIEKKYDELLDTNDSECNFYLQESEKKISQAKKEIENLNCKIIYNNNIVEASDTRIYNLNNKIKKMSNVSHKPLKIVLTLGFYLIFNNKYKIEKLENKLKYTSNHQNKLYLEAQECFQKVGELNKEIEKLYIEIEQKKVFTIENKKKILEEKNDELNKIQKLDCNINKACELGFIPLKVFIGMPYEKIKGCYIIHNTENDKYYVGQSKDIVKRITREHFTGLKVKNIIFAEDFYTSKLENKDDLFEVKIIPCKTKDELDECEKNLIEEYDSFKKGYNGTSGNS